MSRQKGPLLLLSVAVLTMVVLAGCASAAPNPAPTATPTAEKPTVEGSKFVLPDKPQFVPTTEEQRQWWLKETEPARSQVPPTDQTVPPPGTDAEARGGFVGRIYQVVNQDLSPDRDLIETKGYWEWSWTTYSWEWKTTKTVIEGRDRVCGQAAVATVLTNWRNVVNNPANGIQAHDPNTINKVWDRFLPDVWGGWYGTSPWKIREALAGYGMKTYQTYGPEELKKFIGYGYLPILLLDVCAVPEEGWAVSCAGSKGVGLHWVVAHAYDSNGVFLSNWPDDGHITWANLHKAMNSWLTNTVFMTNVVYVPW